MRYLVGLVLVLSVGCGSRLLSGPPPYVRNAFLPSTQTDESELVNPGSDPVAVEVECRMTTVSGAYVFVGQTRSQVVLEPDHALVVDACRQTFCFLDCQILSWSSLEPLED